MGAKDNQRPNCNLDSLKKKAFNLGITVHNAYGGNAHESEGGGGGGGESTTLIGD